MSTEISKWVLGSPNYENHIGKIQNTEGLTELVDKFHTMRLRLLIPTEIIDNMLLKDVKKLEQEIMKFFGGTNDAARDHISNLCFKNVEWLAKYINKNLILEIAPASETLNRTK